MKLSRSCQVKSDWSDSCDTNELLNRLLNDDPDAWTTLVRDYSGLLIATANRMFATYGYKPVAQDAEDVVAVIWTNVLADDRRIIRRCLAHGRWLPTLYTLVRNRAVDVMRRHKLQTVPLDDSRMPGPEPEPTPEPPEIAPDRLRQAMATLNVRERTLVNLFFLQGRKYREIAELTGVSQNSIGPTLGRALNKLRTAIEIGDPE